MHNAGAETRTQEVNSQRLAAQSLSSDDDKCLSYGKCHHAAFSYILYANIPIVGNKEIIWELNNSSKYQDSKVC